MPINKTVHILYINFADINKNEIYIGGIQNYIKSLNDVFVRNGFQVEIYQLAERNDKREINNISINSYGTAQGGPKSVRLMFDYFSRKFDTNDIIIWGTDTIGFKSDFKNVIAIQHGITFDLMYYKNLNSMWKGPVMGAIYKQLQCRKARKNFVKFQNVVCVDYNYLNWIRTQMPRSITDRAEVIPNYADTVQAINVNGTNRDEISILFARRFSFERGAELMMSLIPKVLENYPNVKFTLCGDGPYKNQLEQKFSNHPNVKITKFNIGNSDEFNLSHHITLIPTIGSEGTSFSLLEGMACGAIPIASNVGGMTNVVIDGFNGFLVEPTSDNFFTAIRSIIEMGAEDREELSNNARLTLNRGFSKLRWENRWINYISKLMVK